MSPLRVVFMGTPAFAVPSLEAVLQAGHEVVAVYTQPPRRAGRGQEQRPTPVAEAAAAHGIDLRTPPSLRDAEAIAAFKALAADIAVVVAYGLILPSDILASPRLGCINAHASLLPRWRGAAPIQRAIMAGDSETGVSIMQMDEGLDTGSVLLTRSMPIGATTTAGDLHDALAAASGAMIAEALDGLAAGRLTASPQPGDGITYAEKISKAEARIDWNRPAEEIERAVRGLSPYPGAWFEHAGERIRVLKAHTGPDGTAGEAGTVMTAADTLVVACAGGSALALDRLQRAGKGALEVGAFLRGHPIPVGTVLPCPDTD